MFIYTFSWTTEIDQFYYCFHNHYILKFHVEKELWCLKRLRFTVRWMVLLWKDDISHVNGWILFWTFKLHLLCVRGNCLCLQCVLLFSWPRQRCSHRPRYRAGREVLSLLTSQPRRCSQTQPMPSLTTTPYLRGQSLLCSICTYSVWVVSCR